MPQRIESSELFRKLVFTFLKYSCIIITSFKQVQFISDISTEIDCLDNYQKYEYDTFVFLKCNNI